ncbi:hypothetical protein ACN263_13180 [Micromonospora sp. WMMD729]|uniref:hypothetical protein n=1 Tax=Micromonospora sp. WMMD729 TaxID=3404127 RepID=UPI003BF50F12
MSTDEDRQRLAEQLASSPVRELVDVLRRALPQFTQEAYGMRTVLRSPRTPSARTARTAEAPAP